MTPAKPTSAVIYLRVSTQKQSWSGLGIEAQVGACEALAIRLGIPVLGTFRDEALSGKDGVAKRPGLQGAIKLVKANPGSVLLVHSLSRLGRSQRLIWELLDQHGDYALPLASATEPFETATPMGRAMMGMIGVWAQLEADLASTRTKAALVVAKEKGTRLGAPSMLEKIPNTVAMIKELHASGKYTYRTLTAYLNDMNVPTQKPGRKWHLKTVRQAVVAVPKSVLQSTGDGLVDSTVRPGDG